MAATARTSAMALSCRGLSHMRASQDRNAELRERHPCLPGSDRNKAVARHTRRRVHLQELPRDLAFDTVVYPGRAQIAGRVGEVLVVVVVVAVRRLDANERQYTVAEDGCRQLDAFDELLDDHQVVVLGRRPVRGDELPVID